MYYMDALLPKESWSPIYVWSYIFIALIILSIVSHQMPLTREISFYNIIVPSFVATLLIYIVYKL